MKIKKILKEVKNEKGFTGVDVVIAIAIIVLTISVVALIYVNTTNKSKESIRYSAATRIATQIVENIQSITYDELVHKYSNNYNSIDFDTDGKIFGVSVPVGYSAEVLAPEITSNKLDIIRNVTVNVSYKISNTTKTITLYLTKEKELLEQTNSPDLNMINDYSDSNYYAIKYNNNGNYIITATSDSEWYNYDEGYYALLLKSSTSYSYGDVVSAGEIVSGLYIWIPRYGLDSNSNLVYCYGTSNYQITFSLYDDLLYGYMLTGIGDGENYSISQITEYVTNTFEENDGLTGVWYRPYDTSENDSVAESAYENFVKENPIQNLL